LIGFGSRVVAHRGLVHHTEDTSTLQLRSASSYFEIRFWNYPQLIHGKNPKSPQPAKLFYGFIPF
uniref:Cysteine dioxygenase n=1 Tax=Anisakis simplex TaxID=6269 RepID=A0A0M3KB57_ANISI